MIRILIPVLTAGVVAMSPLAHAEPTIVNPNPSFAWLFGTKPAARQATTQPRVQPSVFARMTAPRQVAPRQVAPRQATSRRVATSRSTAVNPRFLPQLVRIDTKHKKGTIIIDTPKRFLFLVLGNGQAMRYGVGVGRPGFAWSGTHRITRKAEWPGWTPPAAMHKRQPGLPKYMPGGPDNPLGARAMYLGSTLYRIHGSNQPWTIGQAVSSGCIRMRNQDVIDLYKRVGVGTKVIVI